MTVTHWRLISLGLPCVPLPEAWLVTKPSAFILESVAEKSTGWLRRRISQYLQGKITSKRKLDALTSHDAGQPKGRVKRAHQGAGLPWRSYAMMQPTITVQSMTVSQLPRELARTFARQALWR